MNESVDKEPNKSDQQKHHSNITNTSVTIDDSTTFTAESVTTDSVATVAIIDGADANLSNNSVGEKTDKIGQRRYTRIIRDGIRRYACKQCDKTYHRPDGVLLHIKTKHDGIRDHACKLCDKRCTSANELRIHNRSHTGNKH